MSKSREWYYRAKEAQRAGNRALASRLFLRVAARLYEKERLGDALNVYERAFKLRPRNLRCLIGLAVVRSDHRDEKGSREAVRLLVKEFQKLHHRKKLELWIAQRWGRGSELITLFYEMLAETDRTGSKYFRRLAEIYCLKHQYQKALNVLCHAFETKTDDLQVIAEIRSVLESLNDSGRSIYLDRFTQGKLSREDCLLLLHSDHLADHLASPSEGKEKRENDEPEKLSDLVSQLEHELGIGKNDGHSMIAPLIKEFREKANEILGADSNARIDMALAFFEMGLLEEARAELAHVPVSDTRYIRALFLKGQIAIQENSLFEAFDIYQQILRAEPNGENERLEAHYNLTQIFLKLGDLGEALVHLERIEKTSPDYRDTRVLGQTIRERLGAAPQSSKGANRRRASRASRGR